MYTAKQLEKAAPVTVSLKNRSIADVLEACFRNQPLVYTLLDDMVIVKDKTLSIPRFDLPAAQPAVKVRGKVTDEKGQPLPAASVQIKGTQRGALTDGEGNFQLEAETGNVLVISLMGFETVELPVSENMNVVLKIKQSDLEAVVVVGYGTQKKVNLTVP